MYDLLALGISVGCFAFAFGLLYLFSRV